MTGRPTAVELVASHGSPLYVYDGDAVRERWARLRAAMPEGCRIHYAVKANPGLAILALLRSLGAGAEIASEGELRAIQRAGFDPARVLYAGPAKRDEELEAAVDAGALVHAESEGELDRLAAIARRRGAPIRCGVRVQVPWGAEEARTIIGGGETSKFGIPEERARALAPAWAERETLAIVSLHVFNASNVLDADALLAGARRTLELGAFLAGEGLPLEVVDIGGGLGVPYGEEEEELDVEALGSGLGRLLDHARESLPGIHLALEPGRWLLAEAGRYLTRVVDRKVSGGVTFLLCDGGIHHLLRPALVGQPHRVVRAGPIPGGEEAATFRVAGPLCTALDTFGDHRLPAATGPGDLLAVRDAGAYGFTEAMPAFLSHPAPAEILLLDGRAWTIREGRPAARHLEGQRVPDPLA